MVIRKAVSSSLVLILFGVGFLLYNLKYSLDTWANPGPGVFPLMVGAVIVILSVWQLVQDIKKPKSHGVKESHEGTTKSITEFLQRNKGESKILLMIGVFIIYLMMVKWVGFFTSNFLFVIISSRLIGAKDWSGPVALSVGINLFCYFLFEVWLKLSFSRGILF